MRGTAANGENHARTIRPTPPVPPFQRERRHVRPGASGGAPDRAAPPAGAINVLDLGVRNDGTEDVSAIVNRHTTDHALFFRWKIDFE